MRRGIVLSDECIPLTTSIQYFRKRIEIEDEKTKASDESVVLLPTPPVLQRSITMKGMSDLLLEDVKKEPDVEGMDVDETVIVLSSDQEEKEEEVSKKSDHENVTRDR